MFERWRTVLGAACAVCVLGSPAPAQAFSPVVHHVKPGLLVGALEHTVRMWATWELDAPALAAPDEDAWRAIDAFDWETPTPEDWTMVNGYPVVGTPQVDELWHEVTRFKKLHWIRTRYRLRTRHLRELNPDLDLNALEEGQRLLVWRRDPSKVSQSVGTPSRGWLKNGEPFPSGEKHEVLHAHRAFGTYYAVSELTRVLGAYAERFPWAEKLIVGDLSLRRGRKLSPHVSHKSGRDVDLTYPRRTAPPDYRRFHYIPRRDIDVERTLWLVRAFLQSGMVEYMFIDRPIQRLLYKEAQRQGAPEEWLRAVFQYPYRSGTRAIVRASKGHDDHMHIRWRCQPTDRRCR
jgi:murein endopeptidase